MNTLLKKINSSFNLKLTLIAFFGGILALVLASNQQVWFDEAYSIWITKGKSLAETTALTSVDAHPPLYYWILNIWGNLGGWNFIWLRILSIIFFSLSIFASGKLIEKIFNQKISLGATSLLVLSPFLLRYAFEIRMYSLASLITIASTYLFILIQKSPQNKKYWISYGLVVASGMLTLYTLVLVFFSQFLVGIYQNYRQKNWGIWREGWFKAYVLAVAIYLLWLPSLFYQLKNSASSGIGAYFDGAQIKNVVDFIAFYKPWGDVFWIFTLAVVAFWVWIFKKAQLNKTFSQNKKFKTLFILATLPFIITLIISQPFILSKPFFVERYMAQFVILFYICLAVSLCFALKNINQEKARLTLLGSVLIFAVGIFNLSAVGNFNYQNYRESNAAQNMAKIEQFCGNTPIIMDDIYLFMELQIYNQKCDLKIYTPENNSYGGGYAPINKFPKRIIGEQLNSHEKFFVVMNKDKSAEFVNSSIFSQKTVSNLPEFNNLSIYFFENNFDFLAKSW